MRVLKWEDKSDWWTDNEYSLNIRRPDPADLALVTKNRQGKGVHVEFNSTETVDEWDDACSVDGTCTWWKHFHHDIVDPRSNSEIEDEVFGDTGRFSVIIGMLGLDVAHTDHHAELHPVYALFLDLGPVSGSSNVLSPHHWAFFVKNWGSEGYCGHDDEQLWTDHIDVQLPVLKIIDHTVFSYRHGQNHEACKRDPGVEIDPNGVMRFHLGTPDMKCGYVGDLTATPLRLIEGSGGPVSVPHEAETSEGLEGDPRLIPRIAKLSSIDRQQLNKQLSALMSAPKTGPSVDRIEVKQLSSPLPHVEGPLPEFRAVADPAWEANEEKKRRSIDAFLKAHGVQ